MRSVCVPLVANETNGPCTPTPQPLSCQPQPLNPHAKQSSRLITSELEVPIRLFAVPCSSTLSLNCTKTESLNGSSFCALPRIHKRYGTPACAENCISTKVPGLASAFESFAAPASGLCKRAPLAAVASLTTW